MALPDREFFRQIWEILGRRAFNRLRPRIPSRTLQNALRLEVFDYGFRLYIPHYWALYLHDGRGPVRPKDKTVLVWYENPLQDDPRLKGGYPVRANQIRRLNASQFKAGLRENRRRARLNRLDGGNRPPFMIIRNTAGPFRGFPFFTEALRGFSQEMREEIQLRLRERILQDLPSGSRTTRVRWGP